MNGARWAEGWRRWGGRLCVAACLLLPAPGAAQTYRPGGENVRRWAQGEIAVRAAANGEVIGAETWELTVQADGSRSLRATNHGGSTMHTVVLHAGADFRPHELFVENWTGGTFRNAVFIAVRGPLLDVTSRFDQTTAHSIVKIAQQFSFVSHAMSADVWHGWYHDKDKPGGQPVTVYRVDDTAAQPLQTGTITDETLTWVGQEPIGVPAGQFLCDHFRLGDGFDYWVTGSDAILVKAVVGGVEYVLTALTRDENPTP